MNFMGEINCFNRTKVACDTCTIGKITRIYTTTANRLAGRNLKNYKIFDNYVYFETICAVDMFSFLYKFHLSNYSFANFSFLFFM